MNKASVKCRKCYDTGEILPSGPSDAPVTRCDCGAAIPASIPGPEFYDVSTKRWIKYVYPDANHWCAGWLLYKHCDGHWVTYRKATDADIEAINRAVVQAHHS